MTFQAVAKLIMEKQASMPSRMGELGRVDKKLHNNTSTPKNDSCC